MKKGYDKAIEKSICGFCSNEVTQEKLKGIEKYINDETNKCKKKLEDELIILDKINKNDFQDKNYNHPFSGKITITKFNEDKIFGLIEEFKKYIVEKINNMELKEEKFNLLNEDIENINMDIEKHNEELSKKTKELKEEGNKTTDIKKANIYNDIINNECITEKNKQKKSINLNLKNRREEILKIEEEIKSQNDSLSVIDRFKIYFNEKCKSNNMHFSLEIKDNNYILKSDIIKDIRLKDLSEGEEFFFGFIYFYYENMFKYNENKKLIVIDDPMTSLDNNNKFFIEGMIISFFEKNKAHFNIEDDKQIFILTHHYQFFIDIGYRRISGLKSFHLADKEIINTDNNTTEYKYLFEKIDKFNEIPNENEKFIIGSAIRRCLETFCKFNFNIKGVSKPADYTKYFFKDYENEDIQGFLKFVNSHSHEINEYNDFSEIKKYASLFIDTMLKNFKDHRDAIIGCDETKSIN